MSFTRRNAQVEIAYRSLKGDHVVQTRQPSRWGKWAVLIIHWGIVANFVVQLAYASYMVFDVLSVGDGGPLGRAALELDHEHMVTRRLYAIEFWLAMGGLAVYLAITEIGPRLTQMRQQRTQPHTTD